MVLGLGHSLLFAVAGLTFAIGAEADGPAGSAYQPLPGVAPEPIAEGAGLTNTEDLAAFLDGVMAAQLEPLHIAGATLAVVKDGKIIFAKGYGHADVEKETPVDAAATLFRPGSISKLFTWTAVMQLVEQGKLDLDADVNKYLTQFQIPATFEQPVTLRHFMTHTPGFEDRLLGWTWSRTVADLLPLADALKAHIPARVNPPAVDGLTAAYSNWGAALAGLIVANVSGMDYDTYMDQHVLGPLGMTSSTFREPLPEALAPRMSKGYTFAAGKFEPHDFELFHNVGPAGNLTSTATDMAKFMIAHMQDGAIGDARILKPETARQMHTRQPGPSPLVAGVGLGFYETWINGRRLIGHNGGTLYFNSDLYLLKEANLGLFVSYNTAPTENVGLSTSLMRAFMDRYYPAKLPQLEAPAGARERAARYAGSYGSYRVGHTTNERILALFGSSSYAPTDEGLASGDGDRWIEVKEGVYRAADSETTLVFLEDGRGRMHALAHSLVPSYRLRWFESSGFHYLLLGAGVLSFLVAAAGMLRHWRTDRALPARPRWARRLAGVNGLLLLAFVLLVVLSVSGGLQQLIYGFPPIVRVALALPLLALLLNVALVHCAGNAWRHRDWTAAARIRYSLLVLASLAFLWSVNYWNWLGYRFG